AVALFMHGEIRETESRPMHVAQAAYQPLLQGALRHGRLILIGALRLVLGLGWLLTRLGSEFMPQLDEGDLAIHALRIPGTGLEQAIAMQVILEERLRTFPEVDKVYAKIGTPEVATDPMPPSVADNFVMLKPRSEWPDPRRSKDDLVASIEASIRELPGNNYEITQPIEMRFNELISGVRADLGIKLYGDDLDQLASSAQDIATMVERIPGAADVGVEQVTGLPVLSVTPKLLGLARYGLTIDELQSFLATAIGGEQAGQIHHGDRRFPVVVRLPERLRTDIEALPFLPMPLGADRFVPLGEVADITLAPAPAQISRENGKRRVVVSVNVRDRDLGGFVAEVQQTLQQELSLPTGYWLDYGGTFRQLESASQRLAWMVPMTLVLIIGLLIMAFRSVKDALIVFSGVPLALTGGVLALWLRGMPLSVSAGIGFIALSGIAVLNGLVLVSFIQRLQAQGMAVLQAVTDGAMTRLRPVLMTALVAALGFVPMAFNTGIGAEVQRPLATVVIGGILS